MHSVSYDALRQRRCAKIKFHSANFLVALAMKATPARRVENIIEPITRRLSDKQHISLFVRQFCKTTTPAEKQALEKVQAHCERIVGAAIF